MSHFELLTVHPDPELEASSWDEDLESIEDFAKDRYGLSDNPYDDAPSVHGRFQRSYREGDEEAKNAVAVDHRTDKDTETVINVLLNRTPAEYVTKISPLIMSGMHRERYKKGMEEIWKHIHSSESLMKRGETSEER